MWILNVWVTSWKYDLRWVPWVIDLEKARFFKGIDWVVNTRLQTFLDRWFEFLEVWNELTDSDILQSIDILQSLYWEKVEIYFLNDFDQPEVVFYEWKINGRVVWKRKFIFKTSWLSNKL